MITFGLGFTYFDEPPTGGGETVYMATTVNVTELALTVEAANVGLTTVTVESPISTVSSDTIETSLAVASTEVVVEVAPVDVVVSLEQPQVNVSVSSASADVISVGELGPQGPQGPAGVGGTQTLELLADHDINAHKAISAAGGIAFYADSEDVDLSDRVVGISTEAVPAGTYVTTQVGGEIMFAGWSWTSGPVYVGSTGILTQTPPTSGALVVVGRATAPTKILIEVQQPIFL